MIRSFSIDSFNGSKNHVLLIHKRQIVHTVDVEGYYSFITSENRPNKIDPERDYQILIQFIKYMEVRKSWFSQNIRNVVAK